jgi:lipopolysaccharide export LptBFGC system permease protein LptF
MAWKQNLIVFILGLLVGLIIFSFFEFILPMLQKPSIAENIRKLYELALPGSSVSVESINDFGNLYKILLRVSNQQGTNYLEVYASKDGKYVTENVIYVKESTQQIEKMKNFVDCLYNKGLRVYGATQTNNTAINSATLLQLNILGRYSPKIYVSCDGDNLQTCIQIGLQALPSIVYNNTAYPGVYSAEYLANLTGCKL